MRVNDDIIKKIEEFVSTDTSDQVRVSSLVNSTEPTFAQWASKQGMIISSSFDPKIQMVVRNIVTSSLYIGFIVNEFATNEQYINSVISEDNSVNNIYQKWLLGTMDDKFYVSDEQSASLGPDWLIAVTNHNMFVEGKKAEIAKDKFAKHLTDKLNEIELDL